MVTTAPIPFIAIPRTGPNILADTVTVQGRQADAIDTDFDLINNYATSVDAPRFAVHNSPVAVAGTTAGWTMNQAWGMQAGDYRTLWLSWTYTGAGITSGAPGANIGDQHLATINVPAYLPNEFLTFPCYLTHGLGILEINTAGVVKLLCLSFPGMPINANNFVLAVVEYMPR